MKFPLAKNWALENILKILVLKVFEGEDTVISVFS